MMSDLEYRLNERQKRLMLMPIGRTLQTGNDSNVGSVQSQKSAFHCILCNFL